LPKSRSLPPADRDTREDFAHVGVECTRPNGPCRAAQARAFGPVIEWSPPMTSGITPASTTSRTVSSIASIR
jgi:hypothetical protein